MSEPRQTSRRARHGAQGAQAVLETALIIPIMLFLIAAFLAITLQVETQSELDAATKLAAESVFQAPKTAVDSNVPIYAVPSTGLTNSGPTGCRYAAETFYGTVNSYYARFLTFPSPKPLCLKNGGSPSGPMSEITCDIQHTDATLSQLPVVQCTSSATLQFSKTPLAWAIFWNPTITSVSEAVPPPFRQ